VNRTVVTQNLSDAQLLLPLLDEIAKAGGIARPGEVYDRLAARLAIPDDVRNLTVVMGDGREVNAYERRVRWARQTAVARGLLASPERGVWELTDRGGHALQNAAPGVIVTVFETDRGFFVWGSVEDVVGIIDRASVQLICTSPPYPTRKPRPYGTKPSGEWLDWMLRLFESWRELLTPTGSIFVNLGQTWTPGEPTVDTYLERLVIALEDQLGLHLCQRLYWNAEAKLPGPMPWVGVQRIRLKNTVEPIYWLSATPRPKAHVERILRPYTASGRRALTQRRGDERRPSGATFSKASFAIDHGGAIPSTVIAVNNSASNDAYHRACRAAGIPAHPATMPRAIAELAVDVTTDEDDVVADLFAGSGIVPRVAEDKNRNWIAGDRSHRYIEGARLRFPEARTLTTFAGRAR